MPKNNGGSAFPIALGWLEIDTNSGVQTVVDVRDVSHGMTLRDYFAAKYMAAHVAGWLANDNDYPIRENVAAYAYLQADAMLAARGEQ